MALLRQEIARSTVRVSYPGAEYGAVDLWTFDSQQDAASTAETLLAALAADPCGLVTCCDGTVGVRPLPQVELE